MSNFLSSLLRRVLVKVSHTTCGIHSWNLLHEQICSILLLSVDEFDFSWIFAVTRKVLTILHDASSGTIAC